MAYQTVFKRYELKYVITKEQKEYLLGIMEPYMEIDEYGRSTIRNLYFDTNNYRLIRRSIERPSYKEKLRIRSYERADADSTVFVELKKKYESVVYKRRESMNEAQAVEWMSRREHCNKDNQIIREIDYFLDYYGDLHPAVFLSYDREAYFSKDSADFRVTFDENILCRRNDLSLKADVGGERILKEGLVLMELKTSGGIPLWMTHALCRNKIYKTSFSKYGTAYQKLIFPTLMEGDKDGSNF